MATGIRAVLGICTGIVVAVIGLPTSVSYGFPAQAASTSCRSVFPEVPCLGPLQSDYDYAGEGYGDLGYVWAKAGPEKVIGHVYMKEPAPGEYEVLQRTFTFHTKRGVELAAVYVLRGGDHGHYRYQSVPIQNGHVTLTAVRDTSPPILLLEAKREPNAPPEHHEPNCYVREVPCLGRIQTLFAFNGKVGGAVSLIHVSAGTEESDGTTPNGKPIMQRRVSWRSAPSVSIVVAYVLTIDRENKKTGWHIQRIPTAAHSGQTTLVTEPENPVETEPFVLLEGRWT
jgi:hypothetical protein